MKGKGHWQESERHSLQSRGIETTKTQLALTLQKCSQLRSIQCPADAIPNLQKKLMAELRRLTRNSYPVELIQITRGDDLRHTSTFVYKSEYYDDSNEGYDKKYKEIVIDLDIANKDDTMDLEVKLRGFKPVMNITMNKYKWMDLKMVKEYKWNAKTFNEKEFKQSLKEIKKLLESD